VSADLERLTRRELQVAALVADGRSDREVAEKLFITKRTAEWHVQQILTKLDLKLRSQIAARVSQAEALGFPLLAGDRSPAHSTAFIGWNVANCVVVFWWYGCLAGFSCSRHPLGCKLLKKFHMTALALGSPGTGSKSDPNQVCLPPTTLSSLTTAPPLH
jgi:DNA-binding CsgD family transcriptional regulator